MLVDGGWESIEAATGIDVEEFLRGLDEPPEVMRSMAAFLADRAAFDPATWDADQERAARAAVVETHAGRVVPSTRPHALEACVRTMFGYDPIATLAARHGARSSRWRRPTTRRARGRARWPRRRDARAAAGRRPDPAVSFGHDGHNLMRYRPEAVSAAILSVAGGGRRSQGLRIADAGRLHARRTSATTSPSETFMGMPIPANEVAERAELIRGDARAPTAASRSVAPTEHGEAPITAVHDPGLVRFLEVAWSEVRRTAIDRPFLSADTYPNRSMFEGMSAEAVAALVREPDHAGGRAGFWGLDSAAPLVAGTYVAARAAVDVALTTVDLVLGGAPAAYGLCRPPGHHAARSMYGGYCFFNNAAIAAEAIVRATGERVAILDVDYHHGNGSQQIFWRRGDVRYVSIHADPDRDYPYFLGRADETGEGDGAGENLNIPLRAGTTNERLPRGRRPSARGDRGRARARSSSSRSGSTRTASTRSATSR